MRIDFVTQFTKVYAYETYMLNALKPAFEKLGVECSHIALSEGNFGHYFQKALFDPPDWTISFVDLFPGEPPLSELLQVPHFCWPEKGFSEYCLPLRSTLEWMALSDRSCQMERAFFLPHGMKSLLAKEKFYEIVLFDSLIDTQALKNTWSELFSPEKKVELENALEKCLISTGHPFHALDKADFFPDFYFSLDEYLRAIDSKRFIDSFPNRRVDVFGEHVGNNWLSRLDNSKTVFLHWSLPFTEHFEVLRRSKLLVRFQPPFFDAADEWIFAALACGCLPLTNRSPILEQILGKEAPIFYSSFEEKNALIEKYVGSERLRLEAVHDLSERLLPLHSWEKRAELLLTHLTSQSASV